MHAFSPVFNFESAQLFIGIFGGSESAHNVGDPGLIPGSRRSPGEGNGYPFQSAGLENSRQRSLADYNLWGYKE